MNVISSSLQTPESKLSWSKGRDLPNDVMGYVQCVVIQKELFISHTFSDMDEIKPDIIIRFADNRWTPLPPLKRKEFSIACLNGQLFVIGGAQISNTSHRILVKKLRVWTKTLQGKEAWSDSNYPDIPQGRYNCSAVGHKSTLVVAGGWTLRAANAESLDTIVLLDTEAQPCKWNPLPQHEVCCGGRQPVLYGRNG